MSEEEFYENIEKWIKADVSQWTHITLLAFFCHKYEKKNGVRFKLVRGKKGVTMSKEAADFAKLFRTVAPENYFDLAFEEKQKVRHETNLKVFNYINWMFDYKFRRGDKSITGTKLFLVPSMMVEFERMYSKHLIKQQSENKIDKLLNWINEKNQEILQNYKINKVEDLKTIAKYVEIYKLEESSVERRVLEQAKKLGIKYE